MHSLWQRLKRFGLILSLMVVLGLIILFVPQEYPVPGASNTIISRLAGNEIFDFAEWMGVAWLEKADQISVPVQDFLTDQQRSQLVVTFTQLMNDWGELEWQVRQVYADAAVKDPEAQTQELRAKRDALRQEIELRRPTAEAIIQQQIASILVDEGFGAGGEIFPPVATRITPLPYVLIISPRDEINRVDGEALQAGLSVEEAERIETQVLSTTNQSAL
ncbi:MAG TPA: hypothetical protein VMP08_06295, partial [Anaerolineae bacterium]|nr:hypothetical protein [Anaerolineae bacterium]